MILQPPDVTTTRCYTNYASHHLGVISYWCHIILVSHHLGVTSTLCHIILVSYHLGVTSTLRHIIFVSHHLCVTSTLCNSNLISPQVGIISICRYLLLFQFSVISTWQHNIPQLYHTCVDGRTNVYHFHLLSWHTGVIPTAGISKNLLLLFNYKKIIHFYFTHTY